MEKPNKVGRRNPLATYNLVCGTWPNWQLCFSFFVIETETYKKMNQLPKQQMKSIIITGSMSGYYWVYFNAL